MTLEPIDIRLKLDALQRRLEARGVTDIKFTFSPAAAGLPLSQVGADVIQALEAYLDGKTQPLGYLGDSVREQQTSKQMCKHDWVGDDECAYCTFEDANEELATVREILADFDSEEVHVMAQRAIERIQELESAAETTAEYVAIGTLVDVGDGIGTRAVMWNERRYQLPDGATIYARGSEKSSTVVPASEAYSGGKPDLSRDRGPPGPGEVFTSPVKSATSQPGISLTITCRCGARTTRPPDLGVEERNSPIAGWYCSSETGWLCPSCKSAYRGLSQNGAGDE